MVKIKNWIILVSISLLAIVGTYILVNSPLVDIEKIVLLGNDLQYNLISTSATIGGFLFTGISILISVLEKDRIKRLWDNHYLDNIYRTAIMGIGFNIITIFASLVLLWGMVTEKITILIVKIEICTTILGLLYFVWCVVDLVFILGKMTSKEAPG